ncbi:MAG: hypothetical protein GKC10_05190 [Methanosarcinales archaeon]|nr:hypothetical protein [Methanosarcinales archaeon]
MRRIYGFLVGLLLLVAMYSLIFIQLMFMEGQVENAEPLTAIYWVVVTITTVGYGDVVFHSQVGRLFSTVVAVSGITIFFAVALPMMVTPWFERLNRELPSRPERPMKDHIIICGYDTIVETLAEKLTALNIPYLVIESREDVARSIFRRFPTIYGDPANRQVLLNASIHSARMLLANQKEEINAHIILTVRAISDLTVIAMVDDLGRSRFLGYAGASRIISPKTLLGTFLAQITSTPRKGVFPGAISLFGKLMLVEIPIYSQSFLVGKKSHDPAIIETGASIVGTWQRGVFRPVSQLGEGEEIASNTLILAVGDLDQLSRLRDLTTSMLREGSFVVTGYGDVGRRVVKVLCELGIHPMVVDRRDLVGKEFRTIAGDGASEDVLIKAGVKEASGILIMLNNDSDVVYSTLIIRNLNPQAFIIARANYLRSTEKIYMAGADYVASVPLVASHMLAKIAQAEEEALAMLYDGLEIKWHHIGKRSRLASKCVGELDLSKRFECTVAAISRAGQDVAAITPSTVLMPEDTIIVIGPPSGIQAFARFYDDGILPVRMWRRRKKQWMQ